MPERIARGYAAGTVDRLARGLLLIALIPLVTILGIVVFGALAVPMLAVFTMLGEPGGLIGAIIGLSWFGASLVVIFLILRRGHRWLTRLLTIAEAPAAWLDPGPEEGPAWLVAREPEEDRTYQERLVAADARHASHTGVASSTVADDPGEEP